MEERSVLVSRLGWLVISSRKKAEMRADLFQVEKWLGWQSEGTKFAFRKVLEMQPFQASIKAKVEGDG